MTLTNIPTPHIEAKKEDISKIVIMPGDPLRAQFIADNYLSNVKKVNNVRGMLGFTGKYKDIEVTVMGHGMGNPSIGIYSYELFSFYDVDLIIRVGSCGSYHEEIGVGSVILAEWSTSFSTYAESMGLKLESHIIGAKNSIFDLAKEAAKSLKKDFYTGMVNSSDAFYGVTNGKFIDDLIAKSIILAVEMESYALYVNARKLNKTAVSILTVSDSLVTGESLPSSDRQTGLKNMIDIALETAKKWKEQKNEQ